jgi:hypothetical protein
MTNSFYQKNPPISMARKSKSGTFKYRFCIPPIFILYYGGTSFIVVLVTFTTASKEDRACIVPLPAPTQERV